MADFMDNQFLADIDYLMKEVEKGGDVRIYTYMQENGPYVSVAGLGVQAGGYPTVVKAIRKWRKAKEYLDEKGI